MKWWSENQEAYNETRKNVIHPSEGMDKFREWLKLYQRPVFIGAPAGFDFTFVYWYLMNYGNMSPFSFSAFDMKTAVAMKLDIPYRKAGKRAFPKKWFKDAGAHTHVAVEDAVEQGKIFINMMNDSSIYKNGKEVS